MPFEGFDFSPFLFPPKRGFFCFFPQAKTICLLIQLLVQPLFSPSLAVSPTPFLCFFSPRTANSLSVSRGRFHQKRCPSPPPRVFSKGRSRYLSYSYARSYLFPLFRCSSFFLMLVFNFSPLYFNDRLTFLRCASPYYLEGTRLPPALMSCSLFPRSYSTSCEMVCLFYTTSMFPTRFQTPFPPRAHNHVGGFAFVPSQPPNPPPHTHRLFF